MVKIAICDDETEFLDLLSDSLDSWCRAASVDTAALPVHKAG